MAEGSRAFGWSARPAMRRRAWSAADLRRPTVLVLGGEGKGLRELTRKTCDQLVSIPMRGSRSSLNVAVATGILLFEAIRQRASA